MGQSFQYPNIVAGTRDHMSKDTYNNLVQPVPLAAAPSGMAYALVNATAKENFLWTPYMSDLRPGTRYTLSVWMAKTDNCDSADIFVIDTDGRYDATLVALKVKPPSGGGLYSLPLQISDAYRSGAHYRIRFDNNGSTDGKDSTLWLADIMLCEGTEPRAWAPAEGEVWP